MFAGIDSGSGLAPSAPARFNAARHEGPGSAERRQHYTPACRLSSMWPGHVRRDQFLTLLHGGTSMWPDGFAGIGGVHVGIAVRHRVLLQ